MEINIKSEEKRVEIWLTRAEGENTALREGLRPLCRKYRAQGYLVAVYHSGARDLTAATSDLLCVNRTRLAELER